MAVGFCSEIAACLRMGRLSLLGGAATEIREGVLKECVDRAGRAVGIIKPLAVREETSGDIKDSPYWIRPFGNVLFSGDAGIAIPSFSPEMIGRDLHGIQYFLFKQVCALKLHDPFFPKAAFLIAGIAALILGGGILTVAASAVIAFAGAKAFIGMCAQRLALQCAPTEVLLGGLQLLTRLKQNELDENKHRPCYRRLPPSRVSESFANELDCITGELVKRMAAQI